MSQTYRKTRPRRLGIRTGRDETRRETEFQLLKPCLEPWMSSFLKVSNVKNWSFTIGLVEIFDRHLHCSSSVGFFGLTIFFSASLGQAQIKKMTNQVSRECNASVTVFDAFRLHLICSVGLAASFWVAHNIYAINLISDQVQTLRLILVVECPITILLYSLLRQNLDQCSYWKAVGRGLLALPAGALLMAFGATILGAPVGTQHLRKTFNWSLLMSLFTFVPAASVFGSSWKDWQRLFAHTRPTGILDYMICLPAHGAVIGAWLGAWPMPLDWERPWQEWPICVSYGAMVGYLVGMVVSMGFILVFHGRRRHIKGD